MMRGSRLSLFVALGLAAGCASQSGSGTLAGLGAVSPDIEDVRVEDGMEQAILGYRSFLEETGESALTPEAMRRLADDYLNGLQ